MSLFGKDATSFSHLDLGILCHSSLQILSSSVRLDGKRWWTAIFRSLQRCSIGFKSGLWLGHSRTVTELLWSHSFVILAVCLGSLSCWKVNLRPSLRSWALWRSPVPAAEKHPHSMMLPPPCFTVGTVLDRWWAVPGFLHTYRLELRPKSSSLIRPENLICHHLGVLRVFFSKLHAGFHVSCTEERLPSCHSAIKPRLVEGCSDGWLSSTFSHLPKASLELSHSDLWVLLYLSHQGSSPPKAQFGRRPALGRVLVVPNVFHLRIMEATVLLGTLSAAEMFL